MKKIKARTGSMFSDKDALLIHSFLAKHFSDGVLEPKEVLELARPRNSPIHQYFNWDDSRAAELFRLNQARELIRCLVVEIDGGEVRQYTVPVVVEGYDHKKYVELSVAREDESIWKQVLLKAMQEAKSWQSRYSHLKELTKISKSITEVENKLKKQGVIENENRKTKGSNNSTNRLSNGKNNTGWRNSSSST